MLKLDIEEIREAIRMGQFTNEAAVCQGVVLRILHALSWPTYDTQIVSPEYSVEGRRVDFALCHPARRPAVFIEVKKIGQSDAAAERQLFEYAFHKGIPMAILTDGQDWQFFLPAEQGEYGERRVYKLDIVEREIDETVARLERYLKYQAICSGSAMEAARADYQNVARERQTKATLPEAWTNSSKKKTIYFSNFLQNALKASAATSQTLIPSLCFFARTFISGAPRRLLRPRQRTLPMHLQNLRPVRARRPP